MPAGHTPDRTFISVDLPAPFSPQIAWISPRWTVIETFDSALTPGNSLLMSRISRMTWPAGVSPSSGPGEEALSWRLESVLI